MKIARGTSAPGRGGTQTVTALAQLIGPVFRFDGAEVGEQRALFGQGFHDRCHLIAKTNQRRLDAFALPILELAAVVAERPVGPIHVFRCEFGDVLLRTTQMPA